MHVGKLGLIGVVGGWWLCKDLQPGPITLLFFASCVFGACVVDTTVVSCRTKYKYKYIPCVAGPSTYKGKEVIKWKHS